VIVLKHNYQFTGKGKVHPRTGPEGPEGEQMYNSTLPSTSALYGVGGQCHDPAALPPGKTRYPLWVGLRPSGRLRKVLPPHRDSIPGPSSP